MSEIQRRQDGRLSGSTIAILMESDFVEPELHYYQRRFAEEGATVEFLTRLWGQESITFTGHEYHQPFTVDGDLESAEERLADFDVLIVPGGMVADRLRFAEDTDQLAPAVRLLRRAFDTPSVLKGIICHGMWLVAPIPEVVRGRRVTCHNNLVSDVRNMGAVYTDQDVVVDGDLVTGRSAGHCHLFARMIIDLVAARRQRPNPVSARPATPALQPTRQPPAELPSGAPQPATRLPTHSFQPDFPFSDLISGYVTGYDPAGGMLGLRTSDGHELEVRLAANVSAEFLRNLGRPYLDAGGHLEDLLVPGCHLFAYGIFYPEAGAYTVEVKRLVFLGRGPGDYTFDEPGWWVDQIRELAAFYRRAQFGDARPVDFADYRTMLRLGGDKGDQHVQETDTISRLVYGMSSAYLLTGDIDFLEVAESGAQYMRDHLRFVDSDNDVVYWYHGIDVRGGTEHKLFTSEFGDDYHAIPMYEQIYALVGLTQLYRITGDRRIAADIDGTLRLFERFFLDTENGGYFSHIDPITLDPRHESLGPNRSRKNWNSVGDHAPAYLINLYLATGEQRHADMLEQTFDLIADHMPATDSPFVDERFHADWSPDHTWAWQQDRAVVGHNLKIAWNMMRMGSIRPKDRYRALADRIGRSMPALGSDTQRGGWYDMVDRHLEAGEKRHRLVWHDRKAWWQQEQAILAYQILAGLTGDREFRRHAAEATAFYNAFFLDHDEGGVYFNVLAAGTPFLVGNERLKGSHSMSMYHSAELCYLATVYQHLLLNDDPLTLWFRPRPDDLPDRLLRVAPDALPPGQVRIDWVEVDGKPHADFDSDTMSVRLPAADAPLTVRVQLSTVVAGPR